MSLDIVLDPLVLEDHLLHDGLLHYLDTRLCYPMV